VDVTIEAKFWKRFNVLSEFCERLTSN
jgi:hypothetical protein